MVWGAFTATPIWPTLQVEDVRMNSSPAIVHVGHVADPGPPGAEPSGTLPNVIHVNGSGRRTCNRLVTNTS